MPPTTITTAERFVADGPFGPPVAIGIGLVMALLFAWTLRPGIRSWGLAIRYFLDPAYRRDLCRAVDAARA